MDAKQVFKQFPRRSDAHKSAYEKIKILLDNKRSALDIERILDQEGPRKAVKKAIQDVCKTDDESIIAEHVAELLLYSRNIKVEAVLEIIGDKRETQIMNSFLDQYKPIVFNKNLEKSLRELFTSFRLAGVESAVVERVLENFGHFYYKEAQDFTTDEGMIKFVNKEEAYEFVYLLIMLHTCHHNPNIENKTNFKWFADSVKEVCKLSYPEMDEKDLMEVFDAIGAAEFESPITRSLKE